MIMLCHWINSTHTRKQADKQKYIATWIMLIYDIV